jgi:diguanylate cyclase (GGDEF)-like protein
LAEVDNTTFLFNMDTIEKALRNLENSHGTQADLDLLKQFIRRAEKYLPTTNNLLSEGGGQSLFRLIRAIMEIAAENEINEIAGTAVAKIAELTQANSCVAFLWNSSNDCLVCLSDQVSPDWIPAYHWPESLPLNSAPFLRSVLSEGRPIQLPVASDSSDVSIQQILQSIGSSQLVAVPFGIHGAPQGLFVLLFQPAARSLSSEEMIFLQLLANQAGVSIENARLIDDTRQRSQELEAVRQASLTLTASLDLQQVFDAILKSTLNLMKDAQDANIFLYENEVLDFGSSMRTDGHLNRLFAPPRQDGLTYTVARLGEPIQVSDIQNHTLFNDSPPDWHGSIIGLPLKIEERVVGVMNVARSQTGGFDESELRVLRLLADQAALAIENARLHNVIRQQALTDALTGLPNRRAFDRRIAEEISRSNRYQHRFALLIIDLNSFKEINDGFGHPAGDLVLKQVATLLRKSLHETDFLARLGGDEFALILPETSADGAVALSTRLQTLLISNEIDLPEGQVRCVTASFGEAIYPDDADNLDDLIQIADRLLYKAKREQKEQ